MLIETWPLVGFDVLIENLEWHARLLCRSLRAIQLRCGSNEYAELVWQHACLCVFRDPVADRRDLLVFALERVNRRRRAVEDRNRIAPVLAVAIHVGHDRAEQTVRLRADLVGGAIVDAQGARAPADVDAEGLPGEGLLEDALAEVAGEKESVGSTAAQGGEEPEMGDADVLRLVHDREVEDHLLALRDRGRQ